MFKTSPHTSYSNTLLLVLSPQDWVIDPLRKDACMLCFFLFHIYLYCVPPKQLSNCKHPYFYALPNKMKFMDFLPVNLQFCVCFHLVHCHYMHFPTVGSILVSEYSICGKGYLFSAGIHFSYGNLTHV